MAFLGTGAPWCLITERLFVLRCFVHRKAWAARDLEMSFLRGKIKLIAAFAFLGLFYFGAYRLFKLLLGFFENNYEVKWKSVFDSGVEILVLFGSIFMLASISVIVVGVCEKGNSKFGTRIAPYLIVCAASALIGWHFGGIGDSNTTGAKFFLFSMIVTNITVYIKLSDTDYGKNK